MSSEKRQYKKKITCVQQFLKYVLIITALIIYKYLQLTTVIFERKILTVSSVRDYSEYKSFRNAIRYTIRVPTAL